MSRLSKQRMAFCKSGFSLVELMASIAIVGIVLAIGIPSYFNWKPGNLYRGAVSRIQRDLNLAKLRPYETRRQVRAEFCTSPGNPPTTFYQIIDGDQATGSTWTLHANCPMTAVEQAAYVAAGRQVTIRDLAGDYPEVTISVPGLSSNVDFSPGGAVSGATITIAHPKYATGANPGTTIAVNPIGRINITWDFDR